MQPEFIIKQLAANKLTLEALFRDVKAEQYAWKPAPEKWSLLEVLCHLYDEEREDFRTRLRLTLEDPTAPFPAIAPPAWVKERNYADRNFQLMLESFLSEREQSLKWLNSLVNPSWKNIHHHAVFGPLSAEMFLANWLAHDYLHIRQVIGIKYNYLMAHSSVRFDYAGNW